MVYEIASDSSFYQLTSVETTQGEGETMKLNDLCSFVENIARLFSALIHFLFCFDMKEKVFEITQNNNALNDSSGQFIPTSAHSSK